jgi:hypothetical protein
MLDMDRRKIVAEINLVRQAVARAVPASNMRAVVRFILTYVLTELEIG